MSYYNREDYVFFAVSGLALACVLAFFGALVIGGVQCVRAEPAQIACRARQMEPMRRTFSASVTCVPSLVRRDTLHVEGR